MSTLVNVVKELHGSAPVPHLEDELSRGIDSVLVLSQRRFAPRAIDSLSSSLRETKNKQTSCRLKKTSKQQRTQTKAQFVGPQTLCLSRHLI